MNTKERIQEITISSDIKMIEALKKMDKIDKKLLIVMDGEVFVSLLSIGDIQRAIIKNIDLGTSILKILRKNIKVASTEDDSRKIKQIMLQHRIEYLPVINNNNQLVNVHFWEDIFTGTIQNKQHTINAPLVIMAGGKGSRLKPFSNIIPKPLFPFGEKTIIETIIDSFLQYSIPSIYLSVNHKADMIKKYLTENAKLPVEVNYIQESKPLGTAGSLFLLKNKLETDFFVSNCDIIINQDYKEIFDYHIYNRNDITLVAALKHYTIPYGTIESGEDGMLIDLKEKPEFTYKINSGLYLLNPNVLSMVPENKFFHITDLINKVVESKGRVGVFPVSEKSWTDIGEWKEYKKTLKNIDL
jgi:dTDP-glucose pyrophosphorylase